MIQLNKKVHMLFQKSIFAKVNIRYSTFVLCILEIELGLGKMYQAKKQNTYSTFQHFMKDNIIMIKK